MSFIFQMLWWDIWKSVASILVILPICFNHRTVSNNLYYNVILSKNISLPLTTSNTFSNVQNWFRFCFFLISHLCICIGWGTNIQKNGAWCYVWHGFSMTIHYADSQNIAYIFLHICLKQIALYKIKWCFIDSIIVFEAWLSMYLVFEMFIQISYHKMSCFLTWCFSTYQRYTPNHMLFRINLTVSFHK